MLPEIAFADTRVIAPLVDVFVFVRVASITSSAGLPAGYAKRPKPVRSVAVSSTLICESSSTE